MKPSFYDKYGRGIDRPINAVAYDLTEGGDDVRGKPHLWDALKSHVHHLLGLYCETSHISRDEVDKQMALWLRINEERK